MKREHAHGKMCEIESSYLISKLSEEATMCCSKCGSRSSDPSTLCSPVRLPSSS